MKVLVLGAGNVGVNVAKNLLHRDIDVTIIEQCPDCVDKLRRVDGLTIIEGNALDPSVLQLADVKNMSYVIAVMGTDEKNIAACKIVKSMFGSCFTISRIRSNFFMNYENSNFLLSENFAVDFAVNPEMDIVSTLFSLLSIKSAFFSCEIGNFICVGVTCQNKCEVINTALMHLPNIARDVDLYIALIIRQSECIIPDGATVVCNGDSVYFVVPKSQIARAIELFGVTKSNKQEVVLFGCGNIGFKLLENIYQNSGDYQITAVDSAKACVENIACKFSDVTPIYGDCLDQKILTDINIKDADTVVCMTNNDQVNVLLSLISKKLGANRTISLASNDIYASLFESESLINPSLITINSILQHITTGTVKKTHVIDNTMWAMLEVTIFENNSYIGKFINELAEDKKIHVMFVSRQEKVYIARRSFTVQQNDKLLLLVNKNDTYKVEKSFLRDFL